MFNPQLYRDKAVDYSQRGKTANGPNEAHEFARLEKSFTALADNEQWLSNNHQKTVQAPGDRVPAGDALREQEEHVLRCLGAALIMQWNILPRKLQREIFDTAGSMGELMETEELRGQIARFLHKHKDETTDGSEAAMD